MEIVPILVKFVVCFTLSSANLNNPIAETEWATIVGRRINVVNRPINQFIGIPYAEPPVGDLRFRLPKPASKPADGKYHADHFGPACSQKRIETHHFKITEIDEDCLYLNVWSPVVKIPSDRPRPVYFFVYGSGWSHGGGSDDRLQGEVLASLGDLVVVSINHRLGFLGLGYGGLDQLPGNMLMADVLLALEWVQQHIAAFGGDPTRVTFGGVSSGAMVISMLLLSPITPSHLFSSAHLMSGLAGDDVLVDNKELALAKTKKMIASLGCGNLEDNLEQISEESLNCLRSVNVSSILDLEVPVEDRVEITGANMTLAFSPMFGDRLLPAPPYQLASEGFPNRSVHMIVGNEQYEDEMSIGFWPETVSQAHDYLVNLVSCILPNMTIEEYEDIFEKYFNGKKSRRDLKSALGGFIGDLYHYCPLLLYAENWAKKGQVVHGYINSYPFQGYSREERPFGTLHGDDATMLFGIAFKKFDKFSDVDRQVTRKFISAISRFATENRCNWPPMLAHDDKVLPLRWFLSKSMNQRKVAVDPKHKICQLWGKLLGIQFS